MRRIIILVLFILSTIRCELLMLNKNIAITNDHGAYWMVVRSNEKTESTCYHMNLGSNMKEVINRLKLLDLNLYKQDTVLEDFVSRGDTLFVIKKGHIGKAKGLFFLTENDLNEAKKSIIIKEKIIIREKPVIRLLKPDNFGYITVLADIPGFFDNITANIKATCDCLPGDTIGEQEIIRIRHEIAEGYRTEDIDFFLKITNIYEN